MKRGFFPQYLAEFIGTFFLVFLACGSIILNKSVPDFDNSLIPFVFGGSVTVMIYAVGHLSGAHFNPAVTLSFWVIKRLPTKKLLGYLISQLSGALLASIFHLLLWGTVHGFGATILSIDTLSGFLIEFVLSFLLMFVIVAVATDSRAVGELAGLAIGLTVTLCATVGGPLTGASMNPARTLGPNLLQGELAHLWLYFLAPIAGAMVGAKTYEWIRCLREEGEETHGCC